MKKTKTKKKKKYLFAKNASLVWKRVEKRGGQKDPSEKKKLCLCKFFGEEKFEGE